jgi:hypothetical protein
MRLHCSLSTLRVNNIFILGTLRIFSPGTAAGTVFFNVDAAYVFNTPIRSFKALKQESKIKI